jgi:PAS domain S-box-containing protein
MADPESKEPDDIFAAVFESAPDAMVITGQDGRIRLVNAQLEALFGYPRQELMGQPIEMLVPARFRATHVTARQTSAAAPRATGLHRTVELYGSRKDGTEFPVDVSLSRFQTAAGLLVASAIRDLTGVADEVLDIVRGLAENKRLAIERAVDPALGEVVVDPARIRQILYNFREFQQLDSTTGKRYQGTGLGLVLTRRIAEGHGGSVSVRSAPGQGSTFSAVLPRTSPMRLRREFK